MALISDKLNKILSAVFGKDVRQALHDGLDAINRESENTTARQKVLEETFDHLTINAGNSNAEIVAARVKNDGTSFDTIGKRLNDFDEHLDNIVEQFESKFYPEIKGMNLWIDKSTTTTQLDGTFADMVRLGFNGVFIVAYHTLINDNQSGVDMTRDIQDEIIEYAIEKAKEYNFEFICIKPHIWSSGNIKPSDTQEFLNNWKQTVMHYAAMSITHNLKSIVIGNELKNIVEFNYDNWKDMIDTVKDIGLKTMFTFSGVEELTDCCFIDDIDSIGLNLYPSINSDINISKSKALALFGQNGIIGKIKRCEKIIKDKELFLTETGCTRNIDGIKRPASWEFSTDEQTMKGQELYYYSALTTFCCRIMFKGVFFWCAGDTNAQNTFSPFGNELAENVIESFFK